MKLTFAACEDSPACRMEYPDSAARYFDTVARMNEKPVTVEVPQAGSAQAMKLPVSGWMVGELTLDLLAFYDWRTAIAYINGVSVGDSHMIKATAAYILRKHADPHQSSDGVFYSAICQEEFPFDDVGAIRADHRSHMKIAGCGLVRYDRGDLS